MTCAIRSWPSSRRWATTARTPVASSAATSGSEPASRVTSTVGRSGIWAVRTAEATINPSQRRERSSSISAASRSSSLSVSASRHAIPALHSVSSIPRTIGGRTGLVRSGTTTPATPERRVRRLRAVGSGR